MAARSSGVRLDPAVRLALTLRMLAGASHHDLVMLFRIGTSTAYELFHSAIDAILSTLHLPGVPLQDANSLHNLASGFSSSRSIPSPLWGCIRALGGLVIKVAKPSESSVPRAYFCRKEHYGIPVQAVVDSSYRFLYMSALCAGSTHDSLAFAVSPLSRQLMNSETMMTGYWIAADAALECLNSLVTPWSTSQIADPEHGDARDAFNFINRRSVCMWNRASECSLQDLEFFGDR